MGYGLGVIGRACYGWQMRTKITGLVPSDSALRTKLAIQSRVTIFELQFCPNLCKTVCRVAKQHSNGKKAIAVVRYSL